MKNGQDPDRSQFKYALILAMLPGLAYWLAYCYELGYHLYFNIPTSLINVSLVDVCATGAATLTTAIVFKGYGDAMHAAFRKLQTGWLKKTFLIIAVGGTILWMFATIFHLNWDVILLIFALIAGVELVVWVSYISRTIRAGLAIRKEERAGLSHDEAIVAVKSKYQQAATATVTPDDLLQRHVGQTEMALFFALVVISALVVFLGARSAKNETLFMVTRTADSKIVLKKHGNEILLAGFDRNSNQLLNDYVLITLGENSQLQFRYEKLGNLEPAISPAK